MSRMSEAVERSALVIWMARVRCTLTILPMKLDVGELEVSLFAQKISAVYDICGITTALYNSCIDAANTPEAVVARRLTWVAHLVPSPSAYASWSVNRSSSSRRTPRYLTDWLAFTM